MGVTVIKGRSSFHGGVHPPDNKAISAYSSIKQGPLPGPLTIPLSQHIGQICKPIVSKGDQVQAGQKIADDQAYVCAPVHAPLAGMVKDIGLQPHPVLGRCPAIVIEVQQQGDLPTRAMPADLDLERFQPEQIRLAVRQAGVVGMGGAGFPTQVKLDPNPKWRQEILIINGCECEPYITCDYRLMVERAEKILVGALLAAKAWGAKEIYIAIEDNKPKAIETIKDAIGTLSAQAIQLVVLRTRYPQGGERQLIKAVTGRIVPTGGIPPMIGVLVMNVATACAVADAVVLGLPLTHRIVTVTGQAVCKPGNFEVPIGMTVGQLLDFCGVSQKAAKVIIGGPMMGVAIADLSTPIIKTTNAITVLTEEQVRRASLEHSPCIRCGRCLEACPERLNPTLLAHAVKRYDWGLAKENFITACIECGCCSYVCPAKIELAGYIKTGKVFLARQKGSM